MNEQLYRTLPAADLFIRPPTGECVICGKRNSDTDCYESLDGDCWCSNDRPNSGRLGRDAT